MRQVLLVAGGALVAVSLVVGFFTISQVNQEKIDLTSRLQSRSQILADSLGESISPSLAAQSTSTLQRIVNRFASNERLSGLGVFDSSGMILASSVDLPLPENPRFVTDVMDSDESRDDFVRRERDSYYIYAIPLHEEARTIGALVIVQNATYIDESIRGIWRDNLIRLFSQIFLFALAIFVLVRVIFYRSVTRMVASIQALRRGEGRDIDAESGFLQPLAGEISKVASSLHQARFAASEEARMRLEKLDSPWTAERLKEFIKAQLKERPVYVLTNREPYVHMRSRGAVHVSVPASGVITALEPVMDACGGVWIAHGSGTADFDVTDKSGSIKVPPDEPRYTLKRITLTQEEISGYYSGFSNEALWPLCLLAHTRPLFRAEDWQQYKKVNAKFAQTLLDEIKNVERPVVLVQDYHLALVPALIKKKRPDALVTIFWHIPWPSAAQFNICPWRKELLEGILGADLVGFHTQQHCNNFVDTVANEIESRIDFEQFSVIRGEHRTFVKPFPISIAYPGSAELLQKPDKTILHEFGFETPLRILGVDRLDYTKGILERFKGLEFLLLEYPEYIGNLTLLQIASPTRESVEKYREYADAVTKEAKRINERFGTSTWKPIILKRANYDRKTLQHLYRLSQVCLITSLHDGMNLVAKEFAAARADESGVLVLSQFTGAARDLRGALLINPYSAEETSAALRRALTMHESEQRRRMAAMRASVRNYNIYRWSAELIKALAHIEEL